MDDYDKKYQQWRDQKVRAHEHHQTGKIWFSDGTSIDYYTPAEVAKINGQSSAICHSYTDCRKSIVGMLKACKRLGLLDNKFVPRGYDFFQYVYDLMPINIKK